MRINDFQSTKFLYRNLSPDVDDFQEYLSWLRNDENKFIESVRNDLTHEELIKFVTDKNSSPDALLIGVFDRFNDRHVANVKYEPIDHDLSHAWMGILIGCTDMRGKGYSQEIIDSTCEALFKVFKIQNIYLGVDANNLPALNAYRKCNFHEIGTHEKGGIVMLRSFPNFHSLL